MVVWLEDSASPFPPVKRALHNPNGLLAAGGELSPQRLLTAYRQGIFPWFNPGEPILWWSPDPRCVIHPSEIHISKSLRKFIRQSDYTVTFDKAFTKVMQACAEPRSYQQGTWISPKMIAAYTALHHQGIAHSVEVWDGENLVGGLYGLSIGSLFFGESMFSRQTNASKIAFSFLCVQLQQWGFNLIDCQVHNEHLESLGAKLIERDAFCALLAKHVDDPSISQWEFSIDVNAVAQFATGIR
ncbi:leucyl/phenylalanyl-tRNA--protein transferase [Nitrincola schmidtii]|uniref:leucyl/phenylalanyl-tRNA--protein transferase n=1 Tax=Nitrincola schmidtii TaxID=1730894 RepID=UPI00124DD215|nr:leucyl/phenylalanyl-tRNA--protein transferase [Nitrincola schmidtii]